MTNQPMRLSGQTWLKGDDHTLSPRSVVIDLDEHRVAVRISRFPESTPQIIESNDATVAAFFVSLASLLVH